jgi:6,7-dimethyl-8-ribityllumazine synthase
VSQKILLVVAPYYQDITDALVAGAQHKLHAAGFETEILNVSGAFEIPAAIAIAASALDAAQSYAGYVALGCVIRGETSHYDYVCEQSAYGLQQLGITQHLAIGYGILTVENMAQAKARAEINEQHDGRNKGAESAIACLRMIEIKHQFRN